MCVRSSILGCSHKRKCDTRQTATTRERRSADARHTIENHYARQAATVAERIITDACHAIRNGDALKATAIPERPIADACYLISINYCRNFDINICAGSYSGYCAC